MRRYLSRLAFAAVVFGSVGAAQAAPVWVGDFETGDTSQWEGVLNPTFIETVTDPTAQGANAARLTLTNDAVWENGLKRVELNHSPPPERTAEGAELYVAWSFYLPEALPADMSQVIGYWESKNTYHGAMVFEAQGESLLFTTRNPYTQQWQADGVLTPATWHRIALHVLWSTDPTVGRVDLWFDGTQVVTNAVTQTLNDDNWHFLQIGLLRENTPFSDAPVILIDDAVEGDTLADVHPELIAGRGGEGGGGSGGEGSGLVGGGQPDPGTPSDGGASGGVGGGHDGAGVSEPSDGCAMSPTSDGGASLLPFFAAALAIARGRRALSARRRT